MNAKKVRKAVKQARKLIKLADRCQKLAKVDRYIYRKGDKSTAELRRASMELSNKLVDMRRAG